MEKELNYILGLDIGIGSVGWAIRNIDKQKIENLGVRIFDIGEGQKGEPLSLPRRLARSTRRRLKRRSVRMKKVKELFIKYELITKEQLETLYLVKCDRKDPWQLRYDALNRCLTGKELAIILTHLAKRRGFQSSRKSEIIDSDKKKENGKLLQAVQENENIMRYNNYETIGEMFYRFDKFQNQKRNKEKNYTNCVSRELIKKEIETIFKFQRDKFQNKFANKDFEQEYIEIVLFQLPFANEDTILKMIGKCTFEAEEYRIPKNTYTFERFMLLSKINSARISHKGIIRNLTEIERQQIIIEAYNTEKLTYKKIRKILKLDNEQKFTGLTYGKKDDPEGAVFVTLKAYHSLRKVFKDSPYANLILENHNLLDDIGYALTIFKTDKDIKNYLLNKNVEVEIIEKILYISFSGVGHLSSKAIKKLIPYLENGLLYDKACAAVGYKNLKDNQKQKKLPLIPVEYVRNPVVLRALTQCRKVINAIITEYGSPIAVNIELARELSKPYKERKIIENNQKKNKLNKEKIAEQIENELGLSNIRSSDIIKYRLAQEQDWKCIYSQESINPDYLFVPGYYEIDHVIPYSRSFDDSLENKVIVKVAENQTKGNRLPYEYFGKEKRWKVFEKSVELSQLSWKKKQNLLKRRFSEEESKEFKSRNLNDTKYISRFMKNFIEENLIFKESKIIKKVLTVNGRLTDILRARWQLNKDRKESNLHHALDAAIVACVDDKLIYRISEYSKNEELEFVKSGYIDPERNEVFDEVNHRLLSEKFPKPWTSFTEELISRLSTEPQKLLKKYNISGYSEAEILDIEPIFVSMAQKRKIPGEIHKATIRTAKFFDEQKVVEKVNLKEIRIKDLDNLNDREINIKLYNLLKERLEQYDDNIEEAFKEPIYMPKKDGSNGPIIKSVRIVKTQKNGIVIRNGIAEKGEIIRTDFYKNKKGYILDFKYFYNLNERSYIDGDFCFSIFKKDLIYIETKNKKFLGYVKCIEGDGRINLISHDGKEEERIASKTAKKIDKYQVDVLGNKYKVKEKLRGL